jgi:hypothetical protein
MEIVKDPRLKCSDATIMTQCQKLKLRAFLRTGLLVEIGKECLEFKYLHGPRVTKRSEIYSIDLSTFSQVKAHLV